MTDSLYETMAIICPIIAAVTAGILGYLLGLWRGKRARILHAWIVPELPISDAEKAGWREYWQTHQEKFLEEYEV